MNTKQAQEYEKKNPTKAAIIKKAVKRGLKEYKKTFEDLAKS